MNREIWYRDGSKKENEGTVILLGRHPTFFQPEMAVINAVAQLTILEGGYGIFMQISA